jgi:hypothetical protein
MAFDCNLHDGKCCGHTGVCRLRGGSTEDLADALSAYRKDRSNEKLSNKFLSLACDFILANRNIHFLDQNSSMFEFLEILAGNCY